MLFLLVFLLHKHLSLLIIIIFPMYNNNNNVKSTTRTENKHNMWIFQFY